MVPGCFPLPDEVVLSVLLFLDGEDVRSFGNTCRRFRKLITVNKHKLRSPKLQWHEVYLVFGRRISLSRFNDPLPKRTGRVTPVLAGRWEFTEDEFLRDFVNLFFVISPDIMYIKCKDLDDHIADIIRSVVSMSERTLALEMDKCSIGEDGLRCFFKYFSPFYLHIAGRFDRSIISDQVLPLSNLFSLFIGVNRSDLETRTRISGTTVRKIVNNRFRRYSNNQSGHSSENYESRLFCIELPDCDLDYNEFFAFYRELTLLPHGNEEQIRIYNLPKTLIHSIASNVSTFDDIGPTLWVQHGLCNNGDVQLWFRLLCDCHPALLSTRVHSGIRGLPRDPSQLCDTVELQLSVLVHDREELSQRKPLLSLFIALSAGQMSLGMRIPELVLVDAHKRTRRKRNLQI